MSLLFNLEAVQPIHSAKFHGGGSYGEVIFWAMVNRGAKFSCIYDSRKYLAPEILDACKNNDIPLYDLSVCSPQQIIDENGITDFYTPLYSLSPKWQVKVKRFVFTWHGVRALEMPYESQGVAFAKKFAQKVEALFRYREWWKKYYYKPKYQDLAKRIAEGGVDAITVSEHSRASIRSFFPELLHKEIPVFYSPMTEYEPDGFLPPGIKSKEFFLLTSGARWEKNNLRAAKAFDELVSMMESQNQKFDYKLVITGATNPKVYKNAVKHKDRLVLLGYVESKELEFLHKNAYAFIFPSLNEGFGYPPMQSMRYGVPVAASGSSSIPEICDDAAIYFDPYSVSEMKNRMIQLLDESIYQVYAGRALKRYAEVSKRQKEDLQKAVAWILKSEV